MEREYNGSLYLAHKAFTAYRKYKNLDASFWAHSEDLKDKAYSFYWYGGFKKWQVVREITERFCRRYGIRKAGEFDVVVDRVADRVGYTNLQTLKQAYIGNGTFLESGLSLDIDIVRKQTIRLNNDFFATLRFPSDKVIARYKSITLARRTRIYFEVKDAQEDLKQIRKSIKSAQNSIKNRNQR